MFRMDFVHEQRIPEWVTSWIMILGSMQVLILSPIEHAEGYSVFIAMGIPKVAVVYFLGIVGIARIIALYINGKWKRTPLIRAIGATISGCLFLIMTISFYWPTLPLAIVDFRAAWIAGHDKAKAYKNDRRNNSSRKNNSGV